MTNTTNIPDYASGSSVFFCEQALIGALLIESRYLDDIEDVLSGDEFSDPFNRVVFLAMREMRHANTPIDVITVAQHIENHKLSPSSKVLPALGEMVHTAPSPSNAVYYAKSLADRTRAHGQSSELAQLSMELAEASAEMRQHPGVNIKSKVDGIERRLVDLKSQQEDRVTFRHASDVAQDTINDIESCLERKGGITGLSTGFSDLDGMLNGLQAGDLVIVAGRPSMGKTALAVNIGENMSMGGAVGAILSLEMPGKQLTARMCSSIGRLRSEDLRRGTLTEEGFDRLGLACARINQMKLYIDDRSVASVSDVRSLCRKVVAIEGKIDFLIIDYLQLMSEPVSGRGQDTRNEEVSMISRGLKSVAKDMNIPVVALSQLNRSLEKRQDKRPMLSDLRESGALEQDADVIMFVYRDEVYNPDTADAGLAEIIIGKQRNGPTGVVPVNFEKEYSKFSDRKSGF